MELYIGILFFAVILVLLIVWIALCSNKETRNNLMLMSFIFLISFLTSFCSSFSLRMVSKFAILFILYYLLKSFLNLRIFKFSFYQGLYFIILIFQFFITILFFVNFIPITDLIIFSSVLLVLNFDSFYIRKYYNLNFVNILLILSILVFTYFQKVQMTILEYAFNLLVSGFLGFLIGIYTTKLKGRKLITFFFVNMILILLVSYFLKFVYLIVIIFYLFSFFSHKRNRAIFIDLLNKPNFERMFFSVVLGLGFGVFLRSFDSQQMRYLFIGLPMFFIWYFMFIIINYFVFLYFLKGHLLHLKQFLFYYDSGLVILLMYLMLESFVSSRFFLFFIFAIFSIYLIRCFILNRKWITN